MNISSLFPIFYKLCKIIFLSFYLFMIIYADDDEDDDKQRATRTVWKISN